MASTGNRTSDLLILRPTPYPLGHMLQDKGAHIGLIGRNGLFVWFFCGFFVGLFTPYAAMYHNSQSSKDKILVICRKWKMANLINIV